MFSSSPPTSATIADLRSQIARIERGATPRPDSVIPFGVAALDDALPGGGLTLGALHEAAGAGPDTEHGAAAALFLAGVLARMTGPILWVMERADLFAPGLVCVGLHPARVLFAETGRDVLAAMEEGLSHPGLAAVVGEYSGHLSLAASRRLQLAAARSGGLAALLRRGRIFDDPALAAPNAAVTSWRIAALPSPGSGPLGPTLWRLDLRRCRGGKPGVWIMEACDATGHLALAAHLADGPAETERRHA